MDPNDRSLEIGWGRWNEEKGGGDKWFLFICLLL